MKKVSIVFSIGFLILGIIAGVFLCFFGVPMGKIVAVNLLISVMFMCLYVKMGKKVGDETY